MSIYGDDLYRSKKEQIIDLDDLESLTSLYQPLLSKTALCLYINLCKRPEISKTFSKHTELCEKMNCSIDELYEARLELEHVFLLKTYAYTNANNKGSRAVTTYYYEVQKPKSIYDFIKNEVLARMLANQMGANYVKKFIDLENASAFDSIEEVTDRLKPDFSNWNKQKEVEFKEVTKKLPKKEKELNSFDIVHHLELIDELELVIPRSKIQREDLELINEFGLIYKISYQDMIQILNKTINFQSGRLNRDKFKVLTHHKSVNRIEYSENDDPLLYAAMMCETYYERMLKDSEIKDTRGIINHYANLVDNKLINYAIKKSLLSTKDKEISIAYIDAIIENENKKEETKPVKAKTVKAKEEITTAARGGVYFKTSKNGHNYRYEDKIDYSNIDYDVDEVTDDMIEASIRALEEAEGDK